MTRSDRDFSPLKKKHTNKTENRRLDTYFPDKNCPLLPAATKQSKLRNDRTSSTNASPFAAILNYNSWQILTTKSISKQSSL